VLEVGSVGGYNVTEAPTPRPTTDREALGINNKIETYVLQDNATFSDMDRDDP
jgi:hypothetical protein